MCILDIKYLRVFVIRLELILLYFTSSMLLYVRSIEGQTKVNGSTGNLVSPYCDPILAKRSSSVVIHFYLFSFKICSKSCKYFKAYSLLPFIPTQQARFNIYTGTQLRSSTRSRKQNPHLSYSNIDISPFKHIHIPNPCKNTL